MEISTPNQQNQLAGGLPETMTSLEIAEVVNSRHDDVKRSIKRLAERGVIVQPPSADEQSTDAIGRTRVTQVYKVGERDSYVIVAQLSPEFTAKLVDYWQKHRHQMPTIVPTTAEAFANAFMMIANTEKRQAQQEAKIQAISETMDRMAQSLTILDRVPPNGELITHLRKRVAKSFGLSFDVINKVLDVASVHPKFAVRNHHENAEGSVNYGYWQREINLVFRKFVSECEQVTPTMCEHPYIEGRFRLIKRETATSRSAVSTINRRAA